MSLHHKFTNNAFKLTKGSLTSDECIIALYFAEKFSFMAQDTVQSFYWNNSQEAIRSFVMYYQDQFCFAIRNHL